MGIYKLEAEKREKSFRSQRKRTLIIFIYLTLCFAFLIYRLFYLQCIRGEELKRRAAEQQRREVSVGARRGNIYDRNFQPLAAKITTHSLYADPSVVKDKELAARSLSPILGMSEEEILQKLKYKSYFVWLKRQLSDQTADEVKALEIDGLGFEKEEKRFYPKGSLAAHILGFVGMDGTGLDGVEREYDSIMRGNPQEFVSQTDRKGRDLLPPEIGYDEAAYGNDIILTIDEVIQNIAEKELRQACNNWQAVSGSVIIMNAGTGEVLALANYPTYNLNAAFSTIEDCKRNRAIRDLYEPGSVFKIITAAAAINESVVTEEEQINCENGAYEVDGYVIHDVGSYDLLTFSEVLEKSSNIGTVKVARRLGDKRLYEYIDAFGLAKKTGLDLPERAGFVRPLMGWTKRSMFAIPFGHEIAVTPLQMLCAANAIANNGVVMKPFIVRAIVKQDTRPKSVDTELDMSTTAQIPLNPPLERGKITEHLPEGKVEVVAEFSPEEIRTPITSETAKIIRDIMIRVVENGTGENAAVPGYRVAGKTGTAQKADKNGYLPGKYISSFIGFLSAEDITVSMIVVINEPKGEHTGGAVACPVFREIARQVIQYLTVGQRFYVKR